MIVVRASSVFPAVVPADGDNEAPLPVACESIHSACQSSLRGVSSAMASIPRGLRLATGLWVTVIEIVSWYHRRRPRADLADTGM